MDVIKQNPKEGKEMKMETSAPTLDADLQKALDAASTAFVDAEKQRLTDFESATKKLVGLGLTVNEVRAVAGLLSA